MATREPATAAQRARFAESLDVLGATPPLALAVSGGADSLALLLLARAAWPGRIAAATVDHGMRAEAAGEARMVARACERLGVPHRTLAVTVFADGTGLQAAAREARYAALETWAVDAGAAALATAHHLDDQAETLLMRLARGAGVTGLSGVRPRRRLASGIDLVRPLLGWRRDELKAIVEGAGLRAVDDPSNRDDRFDRTRARAMLTAGWPDPSRMAAAAAHLRAADDALAWAADAEAARRIQEDEGAVTIDPTGLPDELLRRLVVRALVRIEPAAAPAGPDVARLVARLHDGEHATLGRVHVVPGDRWRFEGAPPHRTR